ncbi:MAG TPA: MerR family transcriptional regulator [Candidatus Dormibacteraeota bacterium]|nr:MerR family transcriptional regulator [Candidatus Dormibacteraeota bacterium]
MSEAAPLYTVGEVATLLGVSPHTIRAWERRHGMVNPSRTATGQRRYRAEDVELLRDIKRAVDREGVSLKVAFQTVSGSQALDRRVRRGETGRQRQLPRREGVWRGVVDVLPHVVVLLDSQGRIVEANIVAAKEFGVTRQQLHGRLFADLVDPFDRAKAVLLFRPQPKAVDGWELNLATVAGPRLYSFRSWTVGAGDQGRLALVGSQMFQPLVASSPALVADAVAAHAEATAGREPPTDALQQLVDQLPFGVAVATVGPNPRIVYANLRLAGISGVSPRVFTGRPVQELLPRTDLLGALQASISTQTTQVLNGVMLQARSYNVACQPLLSSDNRVAAVLIVLDETLPGAMSEEQLSASLFDRTLDESPTPRELARRVAQDVAVLVPGVPAAVAITAAPPESIAVAYSAAAMDAFRRSPALARSFRRFVRTARWVGPPTDTRTSVSGEAMIFSVIPLSHSRPLGFVASCRRASAAEHPNARVVVSDLVPRLRIASDLLHARMDAARDMARIKAMAAAASLVRQSGSIRDVGARFLEHLAAILNADAAAILVIDGRDFVVHSAYSVDRPYLKLGARLPLTGQAVSRSLKSGTPVETSELGSPLLPKGVNRNARRWKHVLSVPIGSVDGRPHVITMLRKADRPFTDDDANIVETLSGTALFISNEAAPGIAG